LVSFDLGDAGTQQADAVPGGGTRWTDGRQLGRGVAAGNLGHGYSSFAVEQFLDRQHTCSPDGEPANR